MLSFEDQAEKLVTLYTERALLNRRVYDHEQACQKRQSALTPADGWPGKNDEARKAARDAAFAADNDLARHQTALVETRGKLITLQGDIDGAEAERRAGEWHVRARLCDALERGGVQPNHRGDRAENAFEDAAQQKLDQATTESAVDQHAEPYEDGIGPDGIEYPVEEPVAAEAEWPF